MKQKPETRPNKEVLNQFVSWTKVLKKPIKDCLQEAFELYNNRINNLANIAYENAISSSFMYNWKTFRFEIDLLKWAEFKNQALKKNGHDRDVALTIAMMYFNEKYDKKLKEAL